MEQKIKMMEYINLVKQGAVAREVIPMGLNAGWPYLVIRNKRLCVTIPYFRVELKPNDGTLLYPISHCITTTWPNRKVIAYMDLRYDKTFKQLDFNKSIGTFRHDAIKHLTKTDYELLRTELFDCYDGLIACIFDDKPFEKQDRMKELLSLLMEPSLQPIYLNLCKSFYETYLGSSNN